MGTSDLIRLATELAEAGGVHRPTSLINAAVHVTLEHERRGEEVGVGMSDKVALVSTPDGPAIIERYKADRDAASRAPEREGERGGPGGSGTDRGALAGFQVPLVTCPVCRVTAAAFICSAPGCPVNGGMAHPEPGLCNPAPQMTLNGERKPLPRGGISHDPGSPLLRCQDDFGRRRVPRYRDPKE